MLREVTDPFQLLKKRFWIVIIVALLGVIISLLVLGIFDSDLGGAINVHIFAFIVTNLGILILLYFEYKKCKLLKAIIPKYKYSKFFAKDESESTLDLNNENKLKVKIGKLMSWLPHAESNIDKKSIKWILGILVVALILYFFNSNYLELIYRGIIILLFYIVPFNFFRLYRIIHVSYVLFRSIRFRYIKIVIKSSYNIYQMIFILLTVYIIYPLILVYSNLLVTAYMNGFIFGAIYGSLIFELTGVNKIIRKLEGL